MHATTCYTHDELAGYLQGRTTDQLSDAIELHLESCSRCEDTLAGLDDGDDTLIRTLQVTGDAQQEQTPPWAEGLANAPYEAGELASGADEKPPTEPATELGDYELVSVLGRGGMSVVFAARHMHLGRDVALKVLLPTMQQHAVSRERFVREMRAVGGLDHPAIVRAMDAGEWDETLYLVMEQIDGVDLNRVSKLEGPLKIADVCAIGIEVANGLTHAHHQDVVHRDIKPSNLMLDRHGSIKILDFGLARMQSAACDVSLQTTMGQLLGTLDFMAPEQASGSDVDARADIYALGATLFKLLVGAPPHGRSADMPILEYLNRLATNDVKRLDENRDQLPSELVELIASMLQRDPAERTATAAEVADRLLPFAAGADLRELAVSALEKSSASNSEQESAAAVRENLADFWSKPLPTDLEKQPPLPPDSHPHRIGPVGWAALATGVVSVLGLLAFAIVVTLKSPQGDIRIESELDNVRVEVVDEKNKVDVIAVDQDGSTTTVRAGRYRIRLDSPADGIEITPREVVVTKGKTVIAKVKKVASDQPNANPTRDPIAAMEAQLQIEEIETELTKAREQQDPDEAAIGLLEKQLVRLRALSRPIPTEPVYQGRTLADWVAQMHFEQERDAKWAAAESVLKLVETRPVEQRMELILDAGTRMLAWVGRPTDESLHNLLRTGRTVDSSTRTARSSSTTTASKLIVRVDRAEASSHLERALRSDDAQRRDFALLVCAYLREQMRNGDWPSLLSALKSRSETDTGAGQVVSQLVLAASVPDVSSSARLLSSIDAHAASVESLHTAFYAAAERNVDIPRHREIAYTASLFDKAPYAGEFDSVWKTPEIGPFRNVDWDHIEGEMQMDINSVVALLLRSFERRLDAVGDNWANAELQISAAVKSKILTSIIDQANLTGKTRDQGVELLNRRLAQLLHFRAQSAKKPDGAMDTPAAVAVALLLLTGEVPESLKESGRNENGFLAEQLAARKTLIAEDRSVAIPGRSRSGVLSAQAISDLAEWYPYELLDTLHDAASRMNAEVRRTSRWGRSSRSNPMAHMTLQYGLTRIDVRLAIDYAASASDDTVDTLSAAEFVSNSITEMEAKQYLMRHPEFRGAVNDLMNHARNQHAVELGFNIWRTAQSDDDADAKLLDWLKTGSAPRARTAMQRLAVRNDTFSSKWREFQRDRAKDYAAAIDRIAAEQQLTARDIYFLSEMAGDSPSAGPHAVKYLAFWLDNPQKRAREAAIAGLGRGASSLAPCMFILNRDPQQAQPLKQQIQQALDDPDGALAVEDRAQLTGLLRSLLNKGE